MYRTQRESTAQKVSSVQPLNQHLAAIKLDLTSTQLCIWHPSNLHQTFIRFTSDILPTCTWHPSDLGLTAIILASDDWHPSHLYLISITLMHLTSITFASDVYWTCTWPPSLIHLTSITLASDLRQICTLDLAPIKFAPQKTIQLRHLFQVWRLSWRNDNTWTNAFRTWITYIQLRTRAHSNDILSWELDHHYLTVSGPFTAIQRTHAALMFRDIRKCHSISSLKPSKIVHEPVIYWNALQDNKQLSSM